jgi:hypothetical protein
MIYFVDFVIMKDLLLFSMILDSYLYFDIGFHISLNVLVYEYPQSSFSFLYITFTIN